MEILQFGDYRAGQALRVRIVEMIDPDFIPSPWTPLLAPSFSNSSSGSKKRARSGDDASFIMRRAKRPKLAEQQHDSPVPATPMYPESVPSLSVNFGAHLLLKLVQTKLSS